MNSATAERPHTPVSRFAGSCIRCSKTRWHAGFIRAVNPFALPRGDKPKHKTEPGRALTIDECKRFKAAARHDRLEAAWIIGLNTGMRIGEIFGLQWDDVNFETMTISVRRQVTTPRGGPIEIRPLKTDAGRDSPRETTPIGPDTLAALQRRLAAAAAKEKPSVWVFASTNPENPTSPHNARTRSFDKIFVAAQIKVSAKNTRPGPFTPHDLRHTMNSIGAAARISDQVLSERSGHANSTITRRYTHTYADQQRDAADSIEALTRRTALKKPFLTHPRAGLFFPCTSAQGASP